MTLCGRAGTGAEAAPAGTAMLATAVIAAAVVIAARARLRRARAPFVVLLITILPSQKRCEPDVIVLWSGIAT